MASKAHKLKQTKYIFITGGVLSSLGKGIASASIGLLLKQRGYKTTIMKLDPYINVDPGTMNPFQHGEVYVTDDGAETDLDLGHYERFLGESLNKTNNTTTGQVYYEVIRKERRGLYLGKTVQVIPHITDEIKKRILTHEGQFDFVICEIGGTVGDIESLPFLEAIRQFTLERGVQNALNILLTYVPYIKSSGELKTKPTQHSFKTLMEYGIQPDILICRTETKLSKEERSKIALFCNVSEEAVIDGLDVENTIYEVPLLYEKSSMTELILKKLRMPLNHLNLKTWSNFVHRIKHPKNEVTVGLIGKYTKYRDSYKSIIEAFIHAGSINNTRVNVELKNSEDITGENVAEVLQGLDGILVGPGFGSRGIEGKIASIKYVRENKIPFFGICLGLQCAVIEFARNVCNLTDANSYEFDKITKNTVIDLMEEQKKIKNKGGTMRLGAYPCILINSTKAHDAYKQDSISERHRHRYEVNNNFRELLQQNGMIMSGLSPDQKLVEIIELKNHPWFLGTQFHPELKSRAVTGQPLFISFIKSVLKRKKSRNSRNNGNKKEQITVIN
ncbi:MAG: CTP synthase [Ignavibacteria bacterium GWB2_35_12]|nr:MAG: CTP synthase [Ignavibacteria bacterium GWB2_35_12]OGU92567.1 MAG: CTP synthase [Ignavibacteria bacterium RIFOXYA2_FULL_35_10]OGV19743.1 MAG: CTP synthase [Ignavibacteria bacterium RIFOXYC2_FULL_35_21]